MKFNKMTEITIIRFYLDFVFVGSRVITRRFSAYLSCLFDDLVLLYLDILAFKKYLYNSIQSQQNSDILTWH